MNAPYRELAAASDREAWLEARKVGIGASESATILGHNPWESPYTWFMKRTAQFVEPSEPEAETRMNWGHRLETVIADAFGEEAGRTVSTAGILLQSTQFPWLLATPDRYQVFVDTSETGLLEIKTSGAHMLPQWEKEIPVYYQIQLQHQMLVTGLTRGSIACLIGGQKFVWQDFSRHEPMCSLIVQKTKEFWDRLQAGDPPDPDDTSSTFETLRRLAPTGETIELPEITLEWHREIQTLARTEREARKQKEHLRRQLAAAMGRADVGILPGRVGAYCWREKTREEYVVPEAKWRELRWSKSSKVLVGPTNMDSPDDIEPDDDLSVFSLT